MKGLKTLPSLGVFSILDLGKVKTLRHDSKGVTDEDILEACAIFGLHASKEVHQRETAMREAEDLRKQRGWCSESPDLHMKGCLLHMHSKNGRKRKETFRMVHRPRQSC